MYPAEIATDFTQGGDGAIRALYRYPARPEGACYVRANMIATIDGAAATSGRSGGLGGDGDRALFSILRDAADVVLVGAGTVRAEDYTTPAAPRLAIVSTHGSIPLSDKLFPANGARPIVIVPQHGLSLERELLTAGAHVIATDTPGAVDLGKALSALASLGMTRVLTEGGPSLLGQLAAAGLLDEVCLTTTPTIAAGDASRIAHGPLAAPHNWHRAHLLADDDGYLFTRWVRDSVDLVGTDRFGQSTDHVG